MHLVCILLIISSEANMTKRVIAALLGVLLILSMAPTVFASDDTTAPVLNSVTLNAAEFQRGEKLTVTVYATESESGFDTTKCYAHFVGQTDLESDMSEDDFMIKLDTVLSDGSGVQGSIVLDERVGATYWLESVYLTDMRKNVGFFCSYENKVPDVKFTLESNYVKPPYVQPNVEITDYSASSTTAHVGDTITYSISVYEPTGIEYANMRLCDMAFHVNSRSYDIPLTLVSGSLYTYTASFTVPEDMCEETYYPFFDFRKGSGEYVSLDYNSFNAEYGDITLKVINPAVKPSDKFPDLLSYSLSSHRLALGQTLTITARIDPKATIVDSITTGIYRYYSALIGSVNLGEIHLYNQGGGVYSGSYQIPFDANPAKYFIGPQFCGWDKGMTRSIGIKEASSFYAYTDDGMPYLRDGVLTIINPLSVSGTDNSMIMQGEVFDPMQGVTASNVFTGDVTDKITVAGGDIDTSVPGIYLIKYIVDDTVTIDGADNAVRYIDYRWIGVTELEPESASSNGEVPLAVTNDALAIGASNGEVSITKDGAAIPYSSEVTAPGEYTLTSSGSSDSASAEGIHILSDGSGSDNSVTAVIDKSGPDASVSWRKDASGLVYVSMKARDISGVTDIKYMAGEQTLDACRSGSTAYTGTFTLPGYGKCTIYSKDKLGNDGIKVVDINKPYSDSAYLWDVDLTAGVLTQDFLKTKYSYRINLGENDESVTLTPVKECDAAVLKINGIVQDSIKVDVANNKTKSVTVKVTYGGKTKAYAFVIKRAISTNNDLKSLTASVNGTGISFDETFDPNRGNYTLNLDENTKSVTIKTEMASPVGRASFKSKTFTLANGETKTVRIMLYAQNGSGKLCVVQIKRAESTNCSLKSLKTNSGSFVLSPAFKPDELNYAITMPYNKSSFTLYACPAGYKASVTIDGVKRTSEKITLASGQSVTVHIVVTAQNTDHTKEYVITITRL